jgi:SAM-dependent methyltransferase
VTDVEPRWYEDFFEGEWLDYLALPVDEELTRRQVEFVVERTAVEPGGRVLDVACGRGRHSVELARRGFRVTGVDLSPRSLELARAAAADAAVEVELVQSDMRDLDFEDEFDAAVSMFTSFGYFEREEDDARVLDRVARALRSNGAFVIDTVDPLVVSREFREVDWRELGDGTLLLERRALDHLTGRSSATWIFARPDGTRSELKHSIRLYTGPELTTMLRAAGLEPAGAWSTWEGAGLGEGSRLILLGRKRA